MILMRREEGGERSEMTSIKKNKDYEKICI